MKHFDICVIGAGPAGSTSAYLLAKLGFSVALIDRAVFPRDKTCGDGITPRGCAILKRLGLYHRIRDAAFACSGVSIRANTQSTFTIPLTSNIDSLSELLVLPRTILDNILVDHAVEAGARFIGDTRIVSVLEPRPSHCEAHAENGDILTCNIAIIATGAESQLLRNSGLMMEKPKVGSAARAYFEGVAGLSPNVLMFFDQVDFPGYGWIFPTSATSANIGCGVFDENHASQKAWLARMVETHPLLQPMLKDATCTGPIKAYPIRSDFRPECSGKGSRLCVGEAAGLVNPITGEGIDYAFESAEFAALSIARQGKPARSGHRGAAERLARDYRRRLRRRFSMKFSFYRWIIGKISSLPAPDVTEMLVKVSQSPAQQRIVVESLFGKFRLRRALHPIFVKEIILPAMKASIAVR